MAKNTPVSSGGHFVHFVDAQVVTWRCGSASEVVRAGLRLLEEREARVRALQEALAEGEASGEAQLFDTNAFLARMHETHGDRIGLQSGALMRTLRSLALPTHSGMSSDVRGSD